MPELAEVETVRKQIEQNFKSRKIKEVVVDETDQYLFAFAKPKDVMKALTGARITGTGRKGKYFWIELNRKPWPIFHLGMSGNIAILNPKLKKAHHEKVWGGAKIWSESDSHLEKRLWFCRLIIKTDQGLELALIDPRRFGRMWLADDPLNHPRLQKLGYDPLQDFPSASILFEKLKKRKKAIKSVLLEQNLFAGVGNWLADEILFQSKLSPHRAANTLSAKQIAVLRKQILLVVKKAVSVNADYERFPKNWLFHERWGKSANAKTSNGHKIIHEEIGGRTSAWVPTVQK